MKTSRAGIIISAMPSLIMLGMFFSLAMHMHSSLGGWPASIGEAGFPPLLLAHVNAAAFCYAAWFISSIVLVPAAIILCFCVKAWRRFIPYLILYAVLFFICRGCMQFAPEPFLYWWND